MWGKVFSDFCFILVFMIEEDVDDGEDDEAEDGEHSKPKTRYMTENKYAPKPGIWIMYFFIWITVIQCTILWSLLGILQIFLYN